MTDVTKKESNSDSIECDVTNKDNQNNENEIKSVNEVKLNNDGDNSENHNDNCENNPDDKNNETCNSKSLVKNESDLNDDTNNQLINEIENIPPPIKEAVEDDPNFAVICSFLEKFGQNLEIKYSIQNLKTMFEDNNKDLVDLHIKLLRKRRKYINKEKWENALTRFCTEYSPFDSYELQEIGYQNATLSLRLRIFVRLLEAMFDYNQKFKSELNLSCEASNLRVSAIGRDIFGYTYWFQMDPDLNFRLYKDELNKNWCLVSKNLEELNDCIQNLEKQLTETFKCATVFVKEEKSDCDLELKTDKNKCSDDISKIKAELTDDDSDDDEQELKSEVNELIKEEDIIEEETEIPKSKVKSLELTSPKKNDIDNVQSDANELNELCEYLIKKTIQSATRPKGRRGKRGRKNRKVKLNSIKKISKEGKENKENTDDEVMNEKELKEQNEEDSKKDEEEEMEEKIELKSKSTKSRKRRSEIEKLKEDFAESLTTKRFSRRIQALQEKKLIEMQEEQKKLEKEMLEKRRKKEAAMAARAAAIMAASFACDKSNDSSDHRKSKRRKKKAIEEDDDYQKDSDSDSDEINEKKKKKRKRKGKKGRNPWEDSDDSEEENMKNTYEDEEDYYDDMLDDDNDVLKFDDNEDEFACEEVDPNYEPVVIRRARTVKKSKDDLTDNDIEQPLINDDKPCMKCGHYDNPHWILLCDKCDDGYHTSCLQPQLFLIPSGEWFCPPCEHKLLIEKLKVEYQHLSEEIERVLLEKQKQKKRWRFAHCEISSENIIKNEFDESLDLDLNAENLDNEALKSESNDGVVNVVKSNKKYREQKRKRRPNGYVRDEINDLLNDDDDDFIDHYESNDSSDEDDDDDDELDTVDKKRRSYSDSDDTSGSYEDDIDKYVYSDEERQSRPRKERKEKHIDINDYSRSGLKLRSARKRKPISYRFKEYDDLIKSAILQEEGEDEMHVEAGLPRSKGKDISNILIANAEMPDFSINPYDTCNEAKTVGDDTNFISTENETNVPKEVNVQSEIKNECSNEADDDVQLISKKVNQRKYQKRKGLTNLDFSDDDEEEDHASDEDFKMGDDEEELDEELTEVEEDNADETEVTESDSDYRTTSRRRSSRIQRKYSFKKSRRNKKSNKKRSKKKFFVDSDDETDDDDAEDDEEDEDELSDDLVDDSDSESSDYTPRTTRRAASRKRFSYREDSSTDDEKYHDDDDDEYYDEELLEKPKRKEKEQSLEKIDPVTYSKESKKRCLDNEKIVEDTKKAKVDSTVTNDDVVEIKKADESTKISKIEQPGESKISEPDKTSQPTPALVVKDNFKNIPQSQTKSSPSTLSIPTTTSAVAIKSCAIKTDNSNYPNYTKSSDVYSKQSTDPLDSIKQMNSKFEYNSNTSSSPAPSSSVNQISPVSTQPPPVSSPAASTNQPYPSVPQGLHYQRHPYPVHPVPSNPVPPSQPSYSSSYPSRAPNANYLPIPPPPQQYLSQPNRPQSFQSPQNSMTTGQYHPPPPQPPPEQGILANIPGPPPPYDSTANILYSPQSSSYVPSQPAACYIPPSPSNQINVSSASRPNMINDKCDDSYTLTNLDSFKTTSATYPTAPNYGSNYTNPPTAPPPPSTQLLNLDSRNPAFSNYSAPSSNKSHYYPRATYDNMIRSPPVSNYYPPHPQSPNVGAGFYHGAPPPPPGMHQQSQFMPPPPPSQHANTNSYHRPLAPPPQDPTAVPPPNYIPRPTTSPRQPNSLPTATSSSPTFRPTLFPPSTSTYSPPNPSYYSYPGFSPSNGGFSIQNLLLNRPPTLTANTAENANSNSVMAVKSAPKVQKSKAKKTKENSKNKELTAIGVVDSGMQSVNPAGIGEPIKTTKGRTKKPKMPKIANLVKDGTGVGAGVGSGVEGGSGSGSNIGDEKATKI